jgi:phage-related protein
MVETFTPPRDPDQSSELTTESRILEVQFGDGYGQASADGLNNLRDVWTLSWSGMSDAEKDAMKDFFRARGDYDPFDWTAPGESTAQRWRIRGGFKTRSRGGDWTIAVSFAEDFSL